MLGWEGWAACLGAIADIVVLPRRCQSELCRCGEDGRSQPGGDAQRLQLGERCLGNKPHSGASPTSILILRSRGRAAVCPSLMRFHRHRRDERAVSITWPSAKTSRSQAPNALSAYLCHLRVLPQRHSVAAPTLTSCETCHHRLRRLPLHAMRVVLRPHPRLSFAVI